MAARDESFRTERVQQFEAITGSEGSVAEHYLEACDWDVDTAIGMHMDSGGVLPSSGASSNKRPRASGRSGAPDPGDMQPAMAATADEVDIRAPIPQKHETLVQDQAGFALPEPKKEDKGVRGGRRRGARSVFDGFRDFQAEARQQELVAAGVEQASTSDAAKKKTLEDLFRPPLDLLTKGSFMAARNKGSTCNKWLMINVQNVQEFACQVLNRDVWSNSAVKDIIKAHFIFWQVYSDSEEGKKYMQFYKVKDWPYISVLDPRTGENLVTWKNVDAMTFCELVSEFVTEHPSPDGSSPMKESPPNKRRKRDNIVDASEDSQLEAAIQASLQQHKTHAVPSSDQESDIENSDEDLETFSDSEEDASSAKPSPVKSVSFDSSKPAECNLASEVNGKADKTMCSLSQQSSTSSSASSQPTSSQEPAGSQEINSGDAPTAESSWKDHIGDENDPIINIIVRFPDGNKEALKIPNSSKLLALIQFVVSKGFSNERYELMTNYPKRKLSYMDFEETFSQIGLPPQETVFVQER